MVNVHFSGITILQGPEHRRKTKIEDMQAQDASLVIANKKVILSGNDAAKLMADEFNLVLPEEFRGKGMAEAEELINSDEKYAPLMERLMEVAWDVPDAVEKYLIARGATEDSINNLRDVDGNPAQVVDV